MDSAATKRRILEVAATAAIIVIGSVLTLALTGGSDPSASAPSASGPAETTDAVEIFDFEYDPSAIQVDAGTEIAITNSDAAAHTFSAVDGSFDSGTIDGDAEGSVTVEEPGTYDYICEFHPYMKGTVEVK